MTHRDQYRTPLNPDGTERMRTTPAFIPPTSTGSGSAGSGSGSGSASRIGQSTDEHHHHH